MSTIIQNSIPARFESFKDQANGYFVEWLQHTTSHGIPNIARSIKQRRIFLSILWIIFFVGSLSYCGYVIIKSFVEYSKYETTVSIDVIRESPTKFPSVTVCNLSPFNEEKALPYIYSKSNDIEGIKCLRELGPNNLTLVNIQECFKTNDTAEIFEIINDRLKRIFANDELSDTERLDYGFNFYEDMLVSCKFNKVKCTADDFTATWNNQYGGCYRFNDGRLKDVLFTTKTGDSFGLELELVVKPPTAKNSFTKRNGIYLVVNNQSASSYALGKGVAIPPGFESYVEVSRTFIKKPKHPYSNCRDSLKAKSAYSKIIFNYFANLGISYYDQELCLNVCYQDKLIDKCNCSDIITPKLKNERHCQSDAEVKCLKEYDEKFSTVNTDVFCGGVCEEKCKREEFDKNTHLSLFPSDAYVSAIASNAETSRFFPNESLSEFARTSFVKVVINYKTLTYTSIEAQARKTFEELLQDIGGSLGLFIGISFLSLIEILELISELCILYYYKKIKKEERPAKLHLGNRLPVGRNLVGPTAIYQRHPLFFNNY